MKISTLRRGYPKEFEIYLKNIKYRIYIGIYGTFMRGVDEDYFLSPSIYPLLFAALEKEDKEMILNTIYRKIRNNLSLNYCEKVILPAAIYHNEDIPNDIFLLLIFGPKKKR